MSIRKFINSLPLPRILLRNFLLRLRSKKFCVNYFFNTQNAFQGTRKLAAKNVTNLDQFREIIHPCSQEAFLMSKEDTVKILRDYEDEYCKEITAHWKSVTKSKKDGSDYFHQLLQVGWSNIHHIFLFE
jgi:hypothetical protein